MQMFMTQGNGSQSWKGVQAGLYRRQGVGSYYHKVLQCITNCKHVQGSIGPRAATTTLNLQGVSIHSRSRGRGAVFEAEGCLLSIGSYKRQCIHGDR